MQKRRIGPAGDPVDKLAGGRAVSCIGGGERKKPAPSRSCKKERGSQTHGTADAPDAAGRFMLSCEKDEKIVYRVLTDWVDCGIVFAMIPSLSVEYTNTAVPQAAGIQHEVDV